MALVSVQRSPSPTKTDDDESVIIMHYYFRLHTLVFQLFDSCENLSVHSFRRRHSDAHRSLSDVYFTVKGTAVILSHPDQAGPHHRSCTDDTELKRHLQLMLNIVHPRDTMSRVVRLQSITENLIRYLAVMENMNEYGQRRVALFGFDHVGNDVSIGLIVPIINSTKVRLDGDGGIVVENFTDMFFFKPVSIQAMWSIFQYVHKEFATIQTLKTSTELAWPDEYVNYMTEDNSIRGLWLISLMEEAQAGDIKPAGHHEALLERSSKSKEAHTEDLMRRELREIMQSVDLEEVTSSDIRQRLEEKVGFVVKPYKDFIDREMLVIMGQLDKPSKIFDYLYLGTEWNASNWDELKGNRVGYILNITKEVDNFYPNEFVYKKIWVSDEATTELLIHWQKTFKFIKKAKDNGSVVLVHCKKGISRSSSTVIAYIMKEYGWSLNAALSHVKKRRNCITPNEGFMEQLQTFDGILQASKNRHSAVFNSTTTSKNKIITASITPSNVHFKACWL
jgi:protein phosphatase slingshot